MEKLFELAISGMRESQLRLQKENTAKEVYKIIGRVEHCELVLSQIKDRLQKTLEDKGGYEK